MVKIIRVDGLPNKQLSCDFRVLMALLHNHNFVGYSISVCCVLRCKELSPWGMFTRVYGLVRPTHRHVALYLFIPFAYDRNVLRNFLELDHGLIHFYDASDHIELPGLAFNCFQYCDLAFTYSFHTDDALVRLSSPHKVHSLQCSDRWHVQYIQYRYNIDTDIAPLQR